VEEQFMRKILLTVVPVVALVLGGCAGMMEQGPSFSDLKAEAKAEMAKAKKMHYLWRDSGKILKKAQAAYDDGNTAKAKKLAKAVILQGKLAQKQAVAQKNAGPDYSF
jgi:hypothetical protein